MKRVLFLFFVISCTFLASAQEVPQALMSAYKQQKSILPSEKIYIQTDRTLYKPGEFIWLNGHVVDADNENSEQSHMLYVEWIGPNGNLIRRLNLRRNGYGMFNGDLNVQHNSVGGVYKIRAYTNWMRNFDQSYFFEKEITVQNVVLPRLLMTLDFEKEAYSRGDEVAATLEVRKADDTPLANYEMSYVVQLDGKTVQTITTRTDNEGEASLVFRLPRDLNTSDGLINVLIPFEGSRESISRAIPIVLNNISLAFYPEGGDLQYGMENRIAFEALNEFGKPADFKGVLVDDLGNVIADVESFHQGLGAFVFQPQQGRKYMLRVDQPRIDNVYQLPKIKKEGIGLRKITQSEKEVAFYIHNPTPQTLYLIAEIGDSIYPVQTIENARSGIYNLKTDNLPMGIMKLTVFDEALKPHAERLVFINKHRQIKIEITPNQKEYLPREFATLNIAVSDSEGKPVTGGFALSVVEDKQHTFIDDKQDNIMSGLLMSEELKGEIFEPNFYFDEEEEKADEALDFVMLTKGWRRFEWKDRLEKKEADWLALKQFDKDILKLRGIVYLNNQPVKGAKVFIEDEENQFVKTDYNGVFTINLPKLKNGYKHLITKYRGFEYKINTSYYQFVYDAPSIPTNSISVNINDIKNSVKITVNEEKSKEKRIGLVDASSDKIQITANNTSTGAIRKISAENIRAIEAVSLNSVAASEVVVVGYGTYKQNNGNMNSYNVDLSADDEHFPNLYVRITSSGNYNSNRQFYAPQYPHYYKNSKNRRYYSKTDFRKTLFWSPFVRLDANGKSRVQFYTADENTTYRAIVEGITHDGQVGRKEETFYVQSPLAIDIKYPELVTTNDEFVVTITIKNNTNQRLPITLETQPNRHYNYLDFDIDKSELIVEANSFISKKLKCNAGTVAGNRAMYFHFQSSISQDYYYKNVNIEAKGFPTSVALAGTQSKTFTFEIDEYEKGTLSGDFVAYPNILGELIDGVKSMIRRPYGCFEQVSSANYPNILAMELLQETNILDPKLKRTALDYMDIAYKKLEGYESSNGGFSLYGRSPGQVRLTAYGIMEFIDMKRVYPGVNQDMIDRSARWLYKKRDGIGGWNGSYYNWRHYSAAQNAYIALALAMHGEYNISKELASISEEAKQSKDWYRLSLAAMANQYTGNSAMAKELVDILMTELKSKGFDKPRVSNTLMYSYGYTRNVEAWSVAAQAIMMTKQTDDIGLLDALMQKIISQKRGYGYFGSTQATIQALKALTGYTRLKEKKFDEEKKGEVTLIVNGTTVSRNTYHHKTYKALKTDIQKYLKIGQNTIEVKFNDDKLAIPFMSELHWYTLKPNSSPECMVQLETTLSKPEVNVGETVRMKIDVKNTKNETVHNPIALVGIPSGLSLQPWQLKELLDKETVAYYEINKNYIVLYFHYFKSTETRTINLDLKADIPGQYKGAASSTYLYYGAEDKNWQHGVDIVVKE